MKLRPVTEEDFRALFEHQADVESAKQAGFTSREWPAFVAHWRTNILEKHSSLARVIEIDGVVAGNVTSWLVDDARWLGYWVARSHFGRGVATEAVTAFLAEVEHMRPLFAGVIESNAASRRVLEKCGFELIDAPTTPGDDGLVELTLVLR